MRNILLITFLSIAVLAVSSSVTTSVFTAANTTASLNCKTISGWVSVVPGIGSVLGIPTEAGCRAGQALSDIISPPEPIDTDIPVREADVFAPNLPDVPGTPDPTGGIPELIAFIYGFAIWIVGAVVFIQITRAGVLWLLAAGSSKQIGQAKSLMTNALFGLILLLSSIVILNTINPALTLNSFELPILTGATPGFDPSLVP